MSFLLKILAPLACLIVVNLCSSSLSGQVGPSPQSTPHPEGTVEADTGRRPAPTLPEWDAPAYPHAGARRTSHGRWDHQYWLFTPADPVPEAAPVVLFFHGWMQLNPVGYGGWIDHLVRQGNIVIYPRYQGGPLTDPSRFLDNAGVALADAVAQLEAGPTRADVTRVVAVGHSMGGLLAVNYAANASAMGLPAPLAVLTVQPGKSTLMPIADLTRLPPALELLAVTGDIDRVTGDADARAVITRATSLPNHQRLLVEYRTDTHGHPALFATHASPLSRHDDYDANLLAAAAGEQVDIFLVGQSFWAGKPDILDQRGYWALLDLLMARAFANSGAATGPEVVPALADAVRRIQLGPWSDGKPIKAPRVLTPAELR